MRDSSSEGAFGEAMDGCDAVIHVTSDMTFGSNPHEVVTSVVAGTETVLRSAARQASSKRFVLTTSSCAVLAPSLNTPLKVGKQDRNQQAVDAAWQWPPYPSDRAFSVYAASKTGGEPAFWHLIEEQRLHFAVNAILPNVNLCRVLIAGRDRCRSTAGLTRPHSLQHRIT